MHDCSDASLYVSNDTSDIAKLKYLTQMFFKTFSVKTTVGFIASTVPNTGYNQLVGMTLTRDFTRRTICGVTGLTLHH